MKNVKSFLLIIILSISFTGCGAMANMSSQEAYDFGYSIGTILSQ